MGASHPKPTSELLLLLHLRPSSAEAAGGRGAGRVIPESGDGAGPSAFMRAEVWNRFAPGLTPPTPAASPCNCSRCLLCYYSPVTPHPPLAFPVSSFLSRGWEFSAVWPWGQELPASLRCPAGYLNHAKDDPSWGREEVQMLILDPGLMVHICFLKKMTLSICVFNKRPSVASPQ